MEVVTHVLNSVYATQVTSWRWSANLAGSSPFRHHKHKHGPVGCVAIGRMIFWQYSNLQKGHSILEVAPTVTTNTTRWISPAIAPATIQDIQGAQHDAIEGRWLQNWSKPYSKHWLTDGCQRHPNLSTRTRPAQERKSTHKPGVHIMLKQFWKATYYNSLAFFHCSRIM